MLIRVTRLAAMLLLATAIGCQVDDILVEVTSHDQATVIRFRYEGSQEPVALTDIVVQESNNNGPMIWDLKSYDQSVVSGRRQEQFDFNKLKQLPIQSVVVSEITLGNVPDGFRQCLPVGEEKPKFSVGKEYEILVLGAGHRGRAKFKI